MKRLWNKFWCRFWMALVVMFALLPLSAMAQENNPPPGTPPLDGLSNFALYSFVLGYLGPWIVEVINREKWQAHIKYGVFFVYCCAAAAGNAYMQRSLNWDDWVRTLLLIVGTGIASYTVQKKAINSLGQKTG